MTAARRADDAPQTLNQLTVERSELLALHADLLESRGTDRLRLPGLDTRRVDLIIAGSMVLTVALEMFGLDRITISAWALREGMVLDAVGRHDPGEWSDDPHAIRRDSVIGLARRCNWPEQHARQVAALAVRIFAATRGIHGLDDDDRELLEFAALLHDIGEHVASSGHHKHGAYLVRNGQLRGFSPAEVELLAAVIRWHRRGEPRTGDEFPLLDERAIARVRALDGILRLADGLDRSRNQVVRSITTTVTPSLVLLRLSTRGDSELELWGARRKRELLERVLDREIELTTHPSEG
jgi:exopolyphosphatase/guanosine-5'-triphosphate,3'-diphosphate pyrophosphatase